MSAIGDSLLVRGARSLATDPEPLCVRIEGGRIVEVAQDLAPRGETVIDAAGQTLIPGLVDVHVHFRDPGLAHKEGWESGSAGALHGGVTSVVEVQNNPPLSTSLKALKDRIAHVQERSRVDFGCLGNLLPDSVPELDAMAPLTPAFKCFLGGSTGLGGQADPAVLEELFAAAARTGRMIVAHCEDENLLRKEKKLYPDADATQHHLVRSEAAEVESVRTSIRLCEETGARLHVFHLSTAEGARLVREANARGTKIGASTAPHYLLLSHDDAARLGNRIRVNPSVKTKADSKGLLDALRDGTVEAIGTDHAPHPLEEKERPYAKAPSGMPSVDLLWPLTWELVRRDLLDVDTALASVTSRAAESLGILHKGRLEVGFDGDLVLFDPNETRRVIGSELPSRSKWSAYEGMELAGFPRTVVRRGEVVFADGRVTVEAGGRPLECQPPEPPG